MAVFEGPASLKGWLLKQLICSDLICCQETQGLCHCLGLLGLAVPCYPAFLLEKKDHFI